jgi:ABC-2 type transport system permease protein
MRASFLAELLKLRKRPATWVIAAVWLTLSVVFGYAFPYLSYRGSFSGPVGSPQPAESVLAEALPENLVPSAIQGFPLFAGALALILGAVATGSEYGWGTLKTVLTQGPRRLAVFGGKALALGLVVLGVVLATFAVDAAASGVVASVTSRPMRWPPPTDLLQGVVGGWLIVGMWCCAGMFLGILARGTTVAIGVGLVWVLAVENLVRIFAAILDPLDVLQRWMPGTNAGALAAALGVPVQGQPGGTPGVTDVVGGMPAALVLVAYLVMFAAASAVLIHRDVT